MRGLPAEEKAWQILPTPLEILAGLGADASVGDQMYQALHRQPTGDRLFVDAILSGAPVEPSFYDGMKAQEVIEAALRSDAEGRRVDMRPEPAVDGPAPSA